MVRLPYFAPVKVGNLEIHGEPISDDAVMVWAYDMNKPEAIGWDAVAGVKFEYCEGNRNQQEKLAWRFRREFEAMVKDRVYSTPLLLTADLAADDWEEVHK